MANKPMKRCPASLVIREMQIKATVRYQPTPTRTGLFQKEKESTSVGEGVEKLEPHTLPAGCKMVQPLWKTVWRFPPKLPYDLAILLLGIYSEELKQGFTQVLVHHCSLDTLFIIAKRQKQPKCVSVEEWTSKMWHMGVHVMEYYSAIKRSEVLLHATTWIHG